MVSAAPYLILFDCDGTLMDSQGAIVRAMQQAFRTNGFAAPDEISIHRVIGLSLCDAVRQLSGRPEGHENIMHDYRLFYRTCEDEVALFPAVRETLQTLRERGYWLGLVTGKSRSGLLRALDSRGLREMFYVMRTADCCPSKPHPAMVLECMQEMGLSARQTGVVGDAIFDIRMAAAAGVSSFGVAYGVSSGEELYSAGATAVADKFSDLLEYFPVLPDAVSVTG